MLCYRDRTYCTNEKCKKECSRKLTDKVIKEAENLGLPIAVAIYDCRNERKNINNLKDLEELYNDVESEE